jgi:hypothetical protein
MHLPLDRLGDLAHCGDHGAFEGERGLDRPRVAHCLLQFPNLTGSSSFLRLDLLTPRIDSSPSYVLADPYLISSSPTSRPFARSMASIQW